MTTLRIPQIGKQTTKILTLCVVALIAVAIMSQPAFAESYGDIKATRKQVAAACNAAGGDGWGFESSGIYGCITDNAEITCDADGNCTGQIYDDDAESAKKGGTNIMTLLTPRSMVDEPHKKKDPRVLTPRPLTEQPKKGTTRQPAQEVR